MNRRSLLKSAALATDALKLGFLTDHAHAQTSSASQTEPYTLPPLPYGYHALEPFIDAETMHLHHYVAKKAACDPAKPCQVHDLMRG